jgi:hypothetical protein
MISPLTTAILLASAAALIQAGNVVVNPNGPFPHTTEKGQYGYNDCGTIDSPKSNCQTLRVNNVQDFCLWGPPYVSTIGNSEAVQVAWCSAPGHGSRLMPKGTLSGVHWISTPHYIQITGQGDFTKINLDPNNNDGGGELDPHGADGNGNPVGGIAIAKINGQNVQIQEWTQFISNTEFCIRLCRPGPDAAKWCQHIYDVMGCYWNEPGNYDNGFDTCAANDVAEPMGIYRQGDGSLSTWYQGEYPTPSAQAPAASSQCTHINTVGGTIGYTVPHTTTTTHKTSTTTTVHKTTTTSHKTTTTSHKTTTTSTNKKPNSTSSIHKRKHTTKKHHHTTKA